MRTLNLASGNKDLQLRSVSSRLYRVVEEQEWKLPLLHSLLEVRDDQWEIRFGDDDVEQLQDDDINDMIHDICVN